MANTENAADKKQEEDKSLVEQQQAANNPEALRQVAENSQNNITAIQGIQSKLENLKEKLQNFIKLSEELQTLGEIPEAERPQAILRIITSHADSMPEFLRDITNDLNHFATSDVPELQQKFQQGTELVSKWSQFGLDMKKNTNNRVEMLKLVVGQGLPLVLETLQFTDALQKLLNKAKESLQSTLEKAQSALGKLKSGISHLFDRKKDPSPEANGPGPEHNQPKLPNV